MRGLSRAGCMILLWAACSVTTAAEPADLRDIDRLIIEGTQHFESRDLRQILQSNFEVALAAHPDADLPGYLRAIKRTLQIAFQHSGCRAASVEASYDQARERIVVQVNEGPRHLCGEVKIVGCQKEIQKILVDCLTTGDDPVQIPWRTGEAAPFDGLIAADMRERVKKSLGDIGRLAAEFEIQIAVPTDTKDATLVVIVHDEGPRAEIGKLVVSGNNRDDAAEILRHLELRPGPAFDSRMPHRISQQLAETGRYVSSEVQASRDTERSDNRHEIYDLRISVREFEHAPPLAQPLSAQEQAILKLRDWSERWSRGDVEEDLIVVGGYDALVEDLTFRVVIAPKRGTIVAVNAGPSDQQPILEEILACYPDRVLIGAPLRQALLEIPHNGALQFTFSCEVRMTGSAEHLESGKPFETAFGMAMKHQSNIAANPLKADLKLLPAALLSMVHNERTECTLHDGQLGISGPDFKAAIDAATGRPIELTYGSRDAGNYLSFKTAVGALAAEQRRIEERLVNVTTKYDAKTPWRSALNFLLDEWISMLEREGKLQPDGERQNELATWRALRKLTGLWQPFMPDDLLPKWAGLKDDSPNGLKLPHQMTDFDVEDIWTSGPAHRALAGHLLGWHRQVTPKTSWLWPAARDAILLWGGENDEDELPRQSLLALLSSPEMGPLGAAFLEWMGIDDEVDARQASLDAFRR